jgi:hypothetical protein
MAASLVLAVCILAVATVQTGGAILPAGAATFIAVISVMIAGLLVNGVARQPGLPLVCATIAGVTLLAGAVLGISGLTAPWALGGLLFIPILVGISSPKRGPAILATFIIVAASLIAALTSGPAIQ